MTGVQTCALPILGTIGVDINLYDGIAIVASYNTDFGDVNGTNIGLGFEF